MSLGAHTGTFLREPRQVVAALRVLVLAGVVLLGLSRAPVRPTLFWFVTAVYGLTNLGYLWARNRDFALPRVKWLVFLFDVACMSLLILARGEQVRSFLAAYFGLVVMTATVEGLGNALLNSLLVAGAYAVLTRWGAPVHELLEFDSLSQAVFFLVIALFTGHLRDGARSEAEKRRLAETATHEIRQELRAASSELQQSEARLQATRESLQASERLAALGMLAAGIAHEMRGPLAAIVGNLSEAPALIDEIDAPAAGSAQAARAEMRGLVRDCELACGQLQRIARDLTGLAREGPAQGGHAAVREAVEGAARLLRVRAGSRIEIRTVLETDAAVAIDPGRLMQVLLNLGGNAIDAMETEGGTLTLAARAEPEGGVLLAVTDTGPGIPPSVLERMYEPFFTTKPPGKGTGLGLHLVREILTAHGGAIECETAPGRGAEFRVRLRTAATATGVNPSHGHPTQDPPHRGRRGDHPQGVGAYAAQGAL